jgi:hypothetical protein
VKILKIISKNLPNALAPQQHRISISTEKLRKYIVKAPKCLSSEPKYSVGMRIK